MSEPENGAHPEAVPRWVAGTAVAGTIVIALGAFWLSFTALADLARRSGIDSNQAWAWPLIVDGIIVVATISVVALHEHGRAATRYPWTLLTAGAAVSVAANAVDAVVSADAVVPPVLAASVSAVPPLVLLASTHLTVELTRRSRRRPMGVALNGSASRRDAALRLRAAGGSYRQIASALGIHPSTVGRWLEPERRSAPSPEDADGVAHLSGQKRTHEHGNPSVERSGAVRQYVRGATHRPDGDRADRSGRLAAARRRGPDEGRDQAVYAGRAGLAPAT